MPPRKKDKHGKPMLTLKEQLLVEGLAQGKSQTQAGKDAGYAESSAHDTASKSIRKPEVAAAIQQRITGVAEATTEEVRALLASHLRADLGDFTPEDFDNNGSPKLQQLKAKGVSRLIKKIKTRRTPIRDNNGVVIDYDVTVDYELHDSQAAASKLMAILGMAKQAETHPNDVARTADYVKSLVDKGMSEVDAQLVVAEAERKVGQWVN